ncbi:MAG: hypothetical protein JSS30_08080 [Verrucomicrobia bacterium]|nr:hypothetical protein [Verrucomicrobiota bacterium]
MHLLKKIVLFCLALGLLQRLCQSQTDGFSRLKVDADLPYEVGWEAVEIPDQPFTYFGCGAQTFAFVSEDGQYVLKFYRHHRTRHPLAFLAPWIPRLQQTVAKRQAKREKDFASYRIAYEKLRQETGLLGIHLGKTDQIHKKVKIYDKLGIEHTIDLDNMTFLLQKKAAPFYATLEEWIDGGYEDKAKQAVHELIALLQTRAQKGIFDKDPDLRTNFGFLDGHPIQFDIGRFKNEPERIDDDELLRITNSLRQWLNEKAPHLVDYLEVELND